MLAAMAAKVAESSIIFISCCFRSLFTSFRFLF